MITSATAKVTKSPAITTDHVYSLLKSVNAMCLLSGSKALLTAVVIPEI